MHFYYIYPFFINYYRPSSLYFFITSLIHHYSSMVKFILIIVIFHVLWDLFCYLIQTTL